MFFVFGWGRQTRKNYGIVTKLHCSHCNNDDYWQLLKSTSWFSLFFIPMIPYSSQKFLICPVCQYGITLDDKKFNELKPLAEANQLLVEGKISEIEHNNRIKLIDNTDAGQEAETQEIKDTSIYCSQCGKEITNNANFCKHCGNKIN